MSRATGRLRGGKWAYKPRKSGFRATRLTFAATGESAYGAWMVYGQPGAERAFAGRLGRFALVWLHAGGTAHREWPGLVWSNVMAVTRTADETCDIFEKVQWLPLLGFAYAWDDDRMTQKAAVGYLLGRHVARHLERGSSTSEAVQFYKLRF